MNWKLWGRGLFAAVLGAVANGIALVAVDANEFNFDDGLAKLCKVALVSALVSAAAYLKQHPDPWGDFVDSGRR